MSDKKEKTPSKMVRIVCTKEAQTRFVDSNQQIIQPETPFDVPEETAPNILTRPGVLRYEDWKREREKVKKAEAEARRKLPQPADAPEAE